VHGRQYRSASSKMFDIDSTAPDPAWSLAVTGFDPIPSASLKAGLLSATD
jgi:hypothetical protein